ncbi:MAG: hypothetical protein MJ125_06480 [Clostridia bacterium]|nr:hypothetical protein [Clostridia bacterium]
MAQARINKKNKVISRIKDCGGVPTLYINGVPFASAAYMTYLEQFAEYGSFAEKGYDFFSFPVLFSGRWINSAADTPPFKKGIFDDKDSPDFSLFDEGVKKILEKCPDAYIFPRVNISMPLWWEEEHPDGVNVKNGASCRESMYSSTWREDAAKMLRRFTNYVVNSEYVSHIAGYQIAGGNTEEWFHFDLNAGACKNVEKPFAEFLKKNYPETEYRGLPDLSLLDREEIYHDDGYLTRYLEFASASVASAISYFASVIKEETDGNTVVGTFYGYSLEVSSPLWGTHSLKTLLEDKNIDFICSPCSYFEGRNPDADWTEMYPADSVKLHGKMCFQECDIRTNLTQLLSEKDISLDPKRLYTSPIWKGPESKTESINLLRRAFCRQLIRGNGLWWFDMWGGWYNDTDIMDEMKHLRDTYVRSIGYAERGSTAQIAAFIDEDVYAYMGNSPVRGMASYQRKALGMTGTPWDIYDIYDFDRVKDKYKAVIFLSPMKTGNMKNAVSFCNENVVPYLILSEDKQNYTPEELRDFCKANSIHVYSETDDILYINENYGAIYALTEGVKKILLSQKKAIRMLIPSGSKTEVTDRIEIYIKKGETVLFERGAI